MLVAVFSALGLVLPGLVTTSKLRAQSPATSDWVIAGSERFTVQANAEDPASCALAYNLEVGNGYIEI
jgi:hypothetical protein